MIDFPTDPKRILLIKPSAIGDVVHALPILNLLRRRWPEAHISWLVTPGCAGLLEGHPQVFQHGVWITPALAHAVGPRLVDRFGRRLPFLELIVIYRDDLMAGFSRALETYNTLVAVEAWEAHKPWAERYRARYGKIVWDRLNRVHTITPAGPGSEITRPRTTS